MMLGRRHFLGSLGAVSAALAVAAKVRKPKYVFLMIGAGLGVSQANLADKYARLIKPKYGEKGLRLNQLPVNAYTTTDNSLGQTTDSAAAGTALACGQKTVNGALCMLPDLETPLKSMAKDALESGKKVGIVTDVPIDHATPASFYAQVPKCSMYYEIDEQLATCGFHYLAGEPMLGRNKADGKTAPLELAKQAGFHHVTDRAGFNGLKPGDGNVLIEKNIRYNIEGKSEIALHEFTRKGIELLDNDNGFFMMVEGGKIDWCGHANDLIANIHETISFDRAVGEALDFCIKHPEESLIIVTSDHECGGLLVTSGEFTERFNSSAKAQRFQSRHYAKQLEQWKKSGTVSADEVYSRLIEAFGLNKLSAKEALHIRGAVDSVMTSVQAEEGDEALLRMYGSKNEAVVSCLRQVAKTAGSCWTSFGHTSTPVRTSAFGVGSEQFVENMDNTDIGNRLRAMILS